MSMVAWFCPRVTVGSIHETGFSEPEVDFGRDLGSANYFQVRFRNASGASLVIQEVFPSCSCVDVSWPETPVADGSEVIISGKFTGVSEVAVRLTATWASAEGAQGWSSCLLRADLGSFGAENTDKDVLIPIPDASFK